MTDVASTIFRAGVMLRTTSTGDVVGNSDGAPGLFVNDFRALSLLVLTVDGNALHVASEDDRTSSRRVVLTPTLPRNTPATIVVERVQTITPNGLHDEITVHNLAKRALSVRVHIDLATDFADPMTLRSDRQRERRGGKRATTVQGNAVHFEYQRSSGEKTFEADVAIRWTGNPQIEKLSATPADASGIALHWQLGLAAGATETIALSVRSGNAREPIGSITPTWDPTSSSVRQRGIDDLNALRMPCPGQPKTVILAAGIPWFLTLFGRDSIIASLLSDADLPGILDGNLRALMSTQAHETDEVRVAQPGKILHELRESELSVLGEVPYARYFGSADATPLFVSAVAASNSPELQRDAETAVRAAVAWMQGDGGLHQHGFVRYVSDPNGLISQGWKDSFDAVAHSDGTIAIGAIALCEVQGYAWRALVDAARLARDVWGDPVWAEQLEREAETLKRRFREHFWIKGESFPALAIDGDGQRVEVVASNAGHLLFSGILTHEEATLVAARLLAADMFTGWGIRTLSATARQYNPLSYHNGSVWPHDTALIAVGMSNYGLHESARQVAQGLLDAGRAFDDRLPELFGGFDREQFQRPVAYDRAARPQAWSAAAGIAASRLLRDTEGA